MKNFNWDTIQVRDLAGMSEGINLENVGVSGTTFFLGGKIDATYFLVSWFVDR